MPTQGEEILQQLRRYEEGKREPAVPAVPAVPASAGVQDDELLNSQLEMLQLATSPGTLARDTAAAAPHTAAAPHPHVHYKSLKILARSPRYFPPLNFGVVESDIYRSGHPQSANYCFLESLNLRTIVYVGDKTNDWEYYRWIKDQDGLQFIHIPLTLKPDTNSFSPLEYNQLSYLIDVVTCPSNRPILIHSNKGRHRVGVLVALLRKQVHGWLLAAIYDEYGKYASHNHGKDSSELQLIEFF